MAMPPTGALMGTPASIKASGELHTEAIEVEPLDSRTSETSRTVYGNAASSGIMGSSARSASNPWPISRRPGPPSGHLFGHLAQGILAGQLLRVRERRLNER